MEPGDKVMFVGCTRSQQMWGENDDPNGMLTLLHQYTVEAVEVHTWHTKVRLAGIEGQFNSVCFTEVS